MDSIKEVIYKCQQKERNAQKALYKYLLPYLKPIASRYLRNNQYVLDVLQESFVKIFLNIQSYEPTKGDLRSWASKIVINKSINYNNRIIGINEHEYKDQDIVVPEIDDSEKISKEKLEVLLKKMPKGYFEVFNLYIIDGYDHQEIGEILEITPESSRKKLSRARQWFKKEGSLQRIITIISIITLIH